MRKLLIVPVVAVALWAGSGPALKYLPLPLAEPDEPAAGQRPAPAPLAVVCSGRVEAVGGEVDVLAQIPGTLAEVRVSEGDVVHKGDVVAVLEGRREIAEVQGAEAQLAVARAKLAQLLAGPGQEEIEQALQEVRAAEAQLEAETRSLSRVSPLVRGSAETPDEFDRRQHRVRQLQSHRNSLQKRYEALRRGALPSEIEVARAEVTLAEARLARAKVEDGYRVLRAPGDAVVLEVYRHVGDSVMTMQPTPVLRLADTSALRVRLEVDEANVLRLQAGAQGTFTVQGVAAEAGRLTVKTVIPMFGPKRLFNPDTSARVDTRILGVLCEAQDRRVPLYVGQRVTARFAPEAATPAGGSVTDRTYEVARNR